MTNLYGHLMKYCPACNLFVPGAFENKQETCSRMVEKKHDGGVRQKEICGKQLRIGIHKRETRGKE